MSGFHLLFILMQYTDSYYKESVLSSLTKVLSITGYLELFSAFRKSDWEGVIQNRVKIVNLCRHKYRLSHWKKPNKQQASLLTPHSLSHTVSFATRIQNSSSTAIDNIFVDNSIIHLSFISPLINGLSVHDALFSQLKICMQQ